MIQEKNMSLEVRRKALYPELFMNAEERVKAEAKLVQQARAEMTAKGLDATMEINNQLGSTADGLWQIVAPNAVDAVSKKYFDFSATSHKVEYGVEGNPQVCPPVMVEVVKDAGEAIVDATNWEQSALVNDYVPVKLHRFSRPFVLTNNDLMRGEQIGTKLVAGIEAVLSMVANAFYKVAKEGAGSTLKVELDTFSPEYVAHKISGMFSEFGGVDDLVLAPDYFAKLIPTNALGLGTGPGSYGIGAIHSTAGLNLKPAEGSAKVSTEGVHGFALRKNGIAAAFGVPDMSNLMGIAVRSLGTVAGVPLLLKSWIDTKQEAIWNSVETMAGFALANAASVAKLTV